MSRRSALHLLPRAPTRAHTHARTAGSPRQKRKKRSSGVAQRPSAASESPRDPAGGCRDCRPRAAGGSSGRRGGRSRGRGRAREEERTRGRAGERPAREGDRGLGRRVDGPARPPRGASLVCVARGPRAPAPSQGRVAPHPTLTSSSGTARPGSPTARPRRSDGARASTRVTQGFSGARRPSARVQESLRVRAQGPQTAAPLPSLRGPLTQTDAPRPLRGDPSTRGNDTRKPSS